MNELLQLKLSIILEKLEKTTIELENLTTVETLQISYNWKEFSKLYAQLNN